MLYSHQTASSTSAAGAQGSSPPPQQPPIGNSPDIATTSATSGAVGQAQAHLRLSPLPHHAHLANQAPDSVDLPPRTVVSFMLENGVLQSLTSLMFNHAA